MRTRLLVALIVAMLATNCTPDVAFTPQRVVCPPVSSAITLDEGWQFALDADDVGAREGWQSPTHDAQAWRTIQAGMAWEQQGIAYDGVAWYRRVLEPMAWQTPFLLMADVDDSATIWLDGEKLADLKAGQAFKVLPLPRLDAPAVLVVRVVDTGGFGGLKRAPRLAMTEAQAVQGATYGAYWGAKLPEYAMPAWTRGGRMAWTMTGGLDHKQETLISAYGALAPFARSATVQLWLVNTRTGETHTANDGRARFSLIEGVPLPQWEWSAGGVMVRAVAFYDANTHAVRWRTWINTPNASEWQARLVVSSLGVNGEQYPIDQIDVRGRRVWLNGQPFLTSVTVPQAHRLGSWATVANGGGVQADVLACEADGAPLLGDGAVALLYPLGAGETVLDVALPYEAGDDFPRLDVDNGQALEQAKRALLEATSRARLVLPDDRLATTARASVGYLLVANDRDGAHPGPLAHDAVWTRDMAYIGLALLKAGHSDLVRRYVDVVFAGQDAAGRVPPIQGERVPWDNDEWDAQGQAIFLAVQYYAFTKDLEALRGWYVNVSAAADFILALRARTANAEDARVRGLLPISLSAEDLGDGEQHYYWDNWWAVAGLRQASIAALALGEADDAARWQAEADDLLATALASAVLAMGAESLDDLPYLPASVETLANSGMARGSVPLLYPLRLVDNEAWLQRAFEAYDARWLAPSNGGYVHREGQYWTYGGIELAHAYQRLGRGDVLHRILGWTLEHQTLPNAYAWAEQVSPTTFGFTGGDMPHAWMSASFFNLLRNMLVMEDGETLRLFDGASAWWFEDGRKLGVERAPTHFGTLTMGIESRLMGVDGVWRGELTLSLAGANPPQGYRWQLPFAPTSVTAEGGTARYEAGVLIFDGETTQITLKFD
jgi:hypothetical protein